MFLASYVWWSKAPCHTIWYNVPGKMYFVVLSSWQRCTQVARPALMKMCVPQFLFGCGVLGHPVFIFPGRPLNSANPASRARQTSL